MYISRSNAKGSEFDNLYLDMNGIIHNCTHPEDGPEPATEEEMFQAMFDYIDRIFAIVRPRQLVYMAIDGVAPRAKINQQRSRRFRAAKETEDKNLVAADMKEEWSKLGFEVRDSHEKSCFDSNVITPGTPFMERLAVALYSYVTDRVANCKAWKNLKVIFSDSSVPGEGEHKIAEYVRRERTQDGYNPNLQHVIYGLDADLIVLALATHEVNFTILREEVFPKRRDQRHNETTAKQGGYRNQKEVGTKKPFQFLRINSLREYLNYEFKYDIENELKNAKDPAVGYYNLERVIDDFVFLCFFVGNDFIPHLPTLDVREGAIDYLIELYKTELPKIGYLTSSQGDIDFVRVRRLLSCIGRKENEIFRERSEKRKKDAERALRPKPYENSDAKSRPSKSLPSFPPKRSAVDGENGFCNPKQVTDAHTTASKEKKQKAPVIWKSMEEFKNALNMRMRERNQVKNPYDNVRLGEKGWKKRYYSQKFKWGFEREQEKVELLGKYMEGLQWVMKYYYVGCISWGWYYPYHYAPFAADLVQCDVTAGDIQFELGKPFAPFTQLQAVMPASSGKLVLPTCYSDLMTNPQSSIIDYYPEKFFLDLNGKRFNWQGVVLLPFIDEYRLNAALKPVQKLLTEEEVKRNSFGHSYVVVHKTSALGMGMGKRESAIISESEDISKELANGQFFGKVSHPLSSFGGVQGPVYTMSFQLPVYKPHSSNLLLSATKPLPKLSRAVLADSRRGGWKQAKFSMLGIAAKNLRNDRSRRLDVKAPAGHPRYSENGYKGGAGRGYWRRQP